MTDSNRENQQAALTSKKEIPTFSGRLYTYEHERGLAGQWGRRAEVDVLIDEIERLEAKWRAEGDAYIDAKDEIERLRAALEECYSIWSHYQGDHPAYVDQMADIINREISDNSSAPIGVQYVNDTLRVSSEVESQPSSKNETATAAFREYMRENDWAVGDPMRYVLEQFAAWLDRRRPSPKGQSGGRERIWVWYEGYNTVRVRYTNPGDDEYAAIEYVRVSDDSYAPTQLRLGDEPWPEDSSVETSPRPGELEQLRRIDRAARAYVDAPPGLSDRAREELHNALFDGRPSAQETSVKPDPRSDKALLDWLESECADLTCVEERNHDDASVSWRVTLPERLRPDEPADSYGSSPRQALDYAMREQESSENGKGDGT